MLRKIGRFCGWTALTLLIFAVGALGVFRLTAALRETQTGADLAPRDGRHVPTSLGRIFVATSGPETGRVVVLVHGTAAWSGFWRDIAGHLAGRGFRVHAIDVPPFGFSDRSPEGRYSRADQARRIHETLTALGASKAIVVGHSFGGGPALEAAMRHPERIAGLALVSAALALPERDGADDASPAWLDAVMGMTWPRDALVAATVTNPALTATLTRTLLHRKEALTPDIVAVLQAPMTLAGSTAAFGAWLPGFLAPDAGAISRRPGEVARFRLPTALIWGAEDAITPLVQARRLAGLLPQATLDVLPGVGHIPHIEATDAFKRLLAEQLRRLTRETE